MHGEIFQIFSVTSVKVLRALRVNSGTPDPCYDRSVDCTRCGACCVAPDIGALDKPLGVRCPHLGSDNLCTVYDRRPEVCRRHAPDELCSAVAAPTLEERVAKYLAWFGLTDEAERVRAAGETSMRAARTPRRLPLIPGTRSRGAPSRGADFVGTPSRGADFAGNG